MTGFWHCVQWHKLHTQYAWDMQFMMACLVHTVRPPVCSPQVSVYCSVIHLWGAVQGSMWLCEGSKHDRTPDREAIITGRTRQKIHPETFFIKEHVDRRPGFELHGAVKHAMWVNAHWSKICRMKVEASEPVLICYTHLYFTFMMLVQYELNKSMGSYK